MSKNHTLKLNEGKIEIGGVSEVISFGEKEVIFRIGERKLVIEGTGLSCESVDVEGGNAVLSGEVRALAYRTGTSAKGIIKRLFR